MYYIINAHFKLRLTGTFNSRWLYWACRLLIYDTYQTMISLRSVRVWIWFIDMHYDNHHRHHNNDACCATFEHIWLVSSYARSTCLKLQSLQLWVFVRLFRWTEFLRTIIFLKHVYPLLLVLIICHGSNPLFVKLHGIFYVRDVWTYLVQFCTSELCPT